MDLETYYDSIVEAGYYPSKKNVRFYMEYVFEGVPLEGVSMLDIGGGSGMFSFYAAASGADRVVCLEPAAAGSDSKVLDRFNALSSRLGRPESVELRAETFQEFSSPGTFDVILLHNSVNHLDEEACMTLGRNIHSVKRYKKIFAELHGLCKPGGKIVVADCARYNFFAFFNLRNPFNPNIEWHKHQSPSLWAKLLEQVGFTEPRIRWTSFNSLGALGRRLLGNRVAAYFLQSHFVLTMTRRSEVGGGRHRRSIIEKS
jgi:SAM-dependent methyltransferase